MDYFLLRFLECFHVDVVCWFPGVDIIFCCFRFQQGWEHLLAGAIMADQNEWHTRGQIMMTEDLGHPTYDIHVVRGDSTNSAAAQRSKVHVCTCRSTYCEGLDDAITKPDLPDEGFDGDFGGLALAERVRDCYADLQFVLRGTAEEQYNMYNNQLSGMGAPIFKAKNQQPSNVDCSTGSLRIFCHCTDDGPDQKGCQKIIEQELSSDPTTLYMRIPCLLHQIHICVSKQLRRLSSFLAVT